MGKKHFFLSNYPQEQEVQRLFMGTEARTTNTVDSLRLRSTFLSWGDL